MWFALIINRQVVLSTKCYIIVNIIISESYGAFCKKCPDFGNILYFLHAHNKFTGVSYTYHYRDTHAVDSLNNEHLSTSQTLVLYSGVCLLLGMLW